MGQLKQKYSEKLTKLKFNNPRIVDWKELDGIIKENNLWDYFLNPLSLADDIRDRIDVKEDYNE